MWNNGIWNNGERGFIFRLVNEGEVSAVFPFFVCVFLEKQSRAKKKKVTTTVSVFLSGNMLHCQNIADEFLNVCIY